MMTLNIVTGKGQSTWREVAGNKVKLELGCEGLDDDSTDSVGSLKFKQ